MLNPYEEAEAWTEYQEREEELDFQNLQITYRHELMQVPEAEGLKEFLRDRDEEVSQPQRGCLTHLQTLIGVTEHD